MEGVYCTCEHFSSLRSLELTQTYRDLVIWYEFVRVEKAAPLILRIFETLHGLLQGNARKNVPVYISQ